MPYGSSSIAGTCKQGLHPACSLFHTRKRCWYSIGTLGKGALDAWKSFSIPHRPARCWIPFKLYIRAHEACTLNMS